MTHSPTPRATGLSVLIVDDDHWTTRAITFALEQEPSITSLAAVHSGADAIAAHRRSAPDVVLMDLNMAPGMSGVTAIEHIRKHDPTARIVVLTTVSSSPGLARALEAGAMAVVRKTASDSDLRGMVVAAASGEDPRLMRHLAQDIVISGDALPGAPAVAPRLTPTEHDILLLVTDGLGYEQIAEHQGITVWTARSHVKRLREKLHADSLAQLIVRALQYRYISG